MAVAEWLPQTSQPLCCRCCKGWKRNVGLTLTPIQGGRYRSLVKSHKCHLRSPNRSRRLLHPLHVPEHLDWGKGDSCRQIYLRERMPKPSTCRCELLPWVWKILFRSRSSLCRCRFPPGTEALLTGGKAAIATAEHPNRSRTGSQDLASSVKASLSPERLPPEGGGLPPPGFSLEPHHVYPEKRRPPNPRHEPGEPATIEEPSGMLGIIRVESGSSAIPLLDSQR